MAPANSILAVKKIKTTREYLLSLPVRVDSLAQHESLFCDSSPQRRISLTASPLRADGTPIFTPASAV